MTADATPAPTPSTQTDLRPHFELYVERPPDQVLACLERRFHEVPWEGDMRGSHVQVMVPTAERHMWSPWLTFDVREEAGGTRLEGRFSPHPAAWTLYMALYAMLGFTGLGLLFFGVSQWLADQTPTALWGLPVLAIMAGLLYGVPFIGQGLTAQQMCAMRLFVSGCVRGEAQGAAADPSCSE